jgi:hypothetical protein
MHFNATTSMSASRFEAENQSGEIDLLGSTSSTSSVPNRFFRRVGRPHNGVVTPFTTGAVDQGNAANEAASAWYRNVRNAMSSFKGSVFAGEAREARRMMWTRATQMLSRVGPYQSRQQRAWRGRGSKRAKAKALSDNYLELQFGWLPLANDIKSAHNTLHNPTPQYKRVSAGARHRAVVSSATSDATIGVCVQEYQERQVTQYEVKYYGEIRARRDPTGSKLLDFGLGVREFAPTAWEILPWSFLVDYFTNVGDIITAKSYASIHPTWAGKTVRSMREITRTSNGHPAPSLAWSRVNVAIASLSRGTAWSVTRAPVIVVEVPSLSWQLPGWKQALNMTALAVSRRLRLFR